MSKGDDVEHEDHGSGGDRASRALARISAQMEREAAKRPAVNQGLAALHRAQVVLNVHEVAVDEYMQARADLVAQMHTGATEDPVETKRIRSQFQAARLKRAQAHLDQADDSSGSGRRSGHPTLIMLRDAEKQQLLDEERANQSLDKL